MAEKTIKSISVEPNVDNKYIVNAKKTNRADNYSYVMTFTQDPKSLNYNPNDVKTAVAYVQPENGTESVNLVSFPAKFAMQGLYRISYDIVTEKRAGQWLTVGDPVEYDAPVLIGDAEVIEYIADDYEAYGQSGTRIRMVCKSGKPPKDGIIFYRILKEGNDVLNELNYYVSFNNSPKIQFVILGVSKDKIEFRRDNTTYKIVCKNK